MSKTAVRDPILAPQPAQAGTHDVAQPVSEQSRGGERPAVLLVVAWGSMLLFSILPELITREILHNPGAVPLITWGRILALAGTTALCLLWSPIRKLWKYPAILLVFALAQEGMTWLSRTAWWHDAVGGLADPFVRS